MIDLAPIWVKNLCSLFYQAEVETYWKYQQHVIFRYTSWDKGHRLQSWSYSCCYLFNVKQIDWSELRNVWSPGSGWKVCPFGSCFTNSLAPKLLDKIKAEEYCCSLTFNRLLSPAHSVPSGSILISPFFSSERESAVQEKGESRDYVALEVFMGLK